MAFKAIKKNKVQHAAASNPYTRATSSSPFKMPSVRNMIGSPQTRAISSLPSEAPIQLSVTKYTDNASACGKEFSSDPLWQVQVVHDCRPSIFEKFIASIQQYLKDTHDAGQEDFPANLAELREQGIVITITNEGDPFQVGFVQWRIACYTDGEPMNLLNFIHDFIGYKIETEKKWKKVDLHVNGFPSFVKPDDWTLNVEVEKNEPFSPFAAWPPYTNKIVLASIEITETPIVCGMLMGNTYSFKDKLEAHGMYGSSMEIGGKREYVRLIGEVNTIVDERVAWLILGLTQVIDNTVVQVRVIKQQERITIHTSVLDFLTRLEAVPTLFVVR